MKISSKTPLAPSPHLDNAVNPSTVLRLPRRRHIVLIGCMLILAFSMLMVLTLHAYIAWTLARPDVVKLESDPMLKLNLPFQNITFPDASGSSELSGWYIPGDSNQTVVFSHGYGANREEYWIPMYDLVKAVHAEHYNIVMFDYGFASEQNRRIATGGVTESRDLLGAIEYAKKTGSERIYVWGFSMGAGTALQAALKTTDIDGMILDSTFLLDPDTLYYNVKQHLDVPREPSLTLLKLFTPLLNGVSLTEVPFDKIHEKQFRVPTFFIHGKLDDKAPYQIAEQLAKNQRSVAYSRSWILPDGSHELLYRYHQQEYLNRTLAFLKEISIIHPSAR